MPGTEYTRNQILTQNTNDFPNNNAGLITPAILRDYNTNVANSVLFLNETGSHATSASYAVSASYANNASTSNQSISASYAVTASYALNAAAAVNTGSLLLTASAATNVITFTKGDNSTFSVTVDTGSAVTVDTGSLMVTGSVVNNTLTFTKGDNTTFSLTVNTGSGASVNTGSLLVTASISNATVTFTKGDNSTFSQTVNNVVNANTASAVSILDDNGNTNHKVVFVNTAVATSGDQLLVDPTSGQFTYNPSSNLLTVTASLANQAVSSSYALTASYAMNAGVTVNTGSLLVTASVSNDIITFTKGNNTTFSQTVNNVKNSITSSVVSVGGDYTNASRKVVFVGTTGASTGEQLLINSSPSDLSYNPTTNILTTTASFAISASYAPGAAVNTGSLLLTASAALNVITFTKGDNTTFAITVDTGSGGGGGSINTGSFATTGSNIFTGDQVVNGLVLGRSGGDQITNTAFGSASLAANTTATNNVAIGYKSLEISNDSSAEGNVAVGSEALKVSTAGAQNVAVGYQAGVALTAGAQNTFVGLQAGQGITGGNNNVAIGKNTLNSGGSVDSNVAVGGQALQSANGNENVAIGSYAGTTISGNTNTLLGTWALTTITTANNNVAIGDHAGENITSGDGNTIIGTYTTSSTGATLSNHLIIGVGGNYGSTLPATNIIEGNIAEGLEIRTGLQITGSVVATGSFISVNGLKGADQGAPSADIWSVSNQYPDYGLFFVEGLANDFYEFRSAGTPTVQIDPDNGRVIANQFTGSLDGNATSASFAQTASLSGTATSASFASTASYVNPLNQQVVFSGSVRGEVSALSITSNTASLNCSLDNFFTLQLVQGTNTYINPTNVNNGQTINILVNTTGSATVSFPSTVKQISGNSYTPTPTTAKDVLTLISFNDSNLYLVNVKNLV